METKASYRRHDLRDAQWKKLEAVLDEIDKKWRLGKETRQFINGVMWILRTGATWRDLPISYGCWKNTNRRFCRWRDRGWWETIFEKFCQETDTEWVMLDASYVKVHPHAAGAAGGNQEMSRTKGGLNSKIHLMVDAHGTPMKLKVTKGTRADSQEALTLLKGQSAQFLLADKAYDTNKIIDYAHANSIQPVIPPKRNRTVLRDYDTYLYQFRHLVENAFLKIKQWRGLATRYAKHSHSFLAALHLRCALLSLQTLI